MSRGLSTFVDDDTYLWAKNFNWYTSGSVQSGLYAVRRTVAGSQYLHKEIMGNPPSEVDHRDRDTLNNCKDNLRLATRSQNCLNTVRKKQKHPGKYRNVLFVSRMKNRPWKVQVHVKNSSPIHGGYFASEEEAHVRAQEIQAKLLGTTEFIND